MKPKVLCGCSTHMKSDASDPGKYRTCEREAGHTGRHMTTYCGKRRFWKNESPTTVTNIGKAERFRLALVMITRVNKDNPVLTYQEMERIAHEALLDKSIPSADRNNPGAPRVD